MLPYAHIMSNGDVLKQIQRILDKPEITLPANVTAQLLFAALIELNRKVENHDANHQADANKTAAWRDAMEHRLGQIESSAQTSNQVEAEKDKVRVTIPAIFERLIQPVIVALVTAVVVGAILLYLRGAP